MNEQEQAIAKIQRMLDYYIQQTLRLLENTIESAKLKFFLLMN